MLATPLLIFFQLCAAAASTEVAEDYLHGCIPDLHSANPRYCFVFIDPEAPPIPPIPDNFNAVGGRYILNVGGDSSFFATGTGWTTIVTLITIVTAKMLLGRCFARGVGV